MAQGVGGTGLNPNVLGCSLKENKSMNIDLRVAKPLSVLIVLCSYMTLGSSVVCASPVQKGHLVMSRSEYLDRVNAIWMGQMIGQLTGLLFKDKPASVLSEHALV